MRAAEGRGVAAAALKIIVKDLVSGGLLSAVSGKGGGYRLVRPAEDYTVGEIIELMEGTLSSVACLAGGSVNCPRAEVCETLPLWEEYDRQKAEERALAAEATEAPAQ